MTKKKTMTETKAMRHLVTVMRRQEITNQKTKPKTIQDKDVQGTP